MSRRRLNMPRLVPPRVGRVSDHALLRWLERSLKIDVEAARASLLTESRREAIACGAVRIRCPEEGVILVIADDGVVITCLPIGKDR